MMKCEFEKMIGKEISTKTFDMYNDMYLATDLSKQEFVSLLNIKAIPESEEAIERRRKANKFKEEIKMLIADLESEIERHKDMLECDLFGKEYWKREIRRCRNEIKSLKMVIA